MVSCYLGLNEHQGFEVWDSTVLVPLAYTSTPTCNRAASDVRFCISDTKGSFKHAELLRHGNPPM